MLLHDTMIIQSYFVIFDRCPFLFSPSCSPLQFIALCAAFRFLCWNERFLEISMFLILTGTSGKVFLIISPSGKDCGIKTRFKSIYTILKGKYNKNKNNVFIHTIFHESNDQHYAIWSYGGCSVQNKLILQKANKQKQTNNKSQRRPQLYYPRQGHRDTVIPLHFTKVCWLNGEITTIITLASTIIEMCIWFHVIAYSTYWWFRQNHSHIVSQMSIVNHINQFEMCP